jgi:DNA-binding MarR family transcriptional regulator
VRVVVDDALCASLSTAEIERAVSEIVFWSVRNDVQQETMRRAKCRLPRGTVWLLARMAKSEPVRLSDLSNSLGVDNSTLTPQAQRLEREGFIVREQDPADGRAALLRVTRTGRALLGRLHRTRCAMFDEVLGDWPDRERARAAAVLSSLARTLEASTVVRGCVSARVQ